MNAPISYRPLTLPEINRIEAKVDAFFASHSVPGRTAGEARWKALTATEDSLRIIFAKLAPAWAKEEEFEDRAMFVHKLDQYKYCLKHALELIDGRFPPLPDVQFDLEPDPKVVEQYQHVVIHASLRRDGVNGDMDWYCPARA